MAAIEQQARRSPHQHAILSNTERLIDTRAQALAEEGKAELEKQTLSVQIGQTLQKRNVKVADLMREWDASGDGQISKVRQSAPFDASLPATPLMIRFLLSAVPLAQMEFRQSIRKLVSNPPVLEIDALFATLDVDGGSTIDVKELEKAMKKFFGRRNEVCTPGSAHRNRVEQIRAKLKNYSPVLQATLAAEEAANALDAFDFTSVSAQLGTLMLRKGLKAADVVVKWGPIR